MRGESHAGRARRGEPWPSCRGTRRGGFSLVELLVALAIAAILLGIAAPSFGSLTRSLSRSTEYNELAGDLRLARIEAIKRGATVAVCARANATSCGEDWAKGWHVFVETSAAEGGTMGEIETGETLLRSRAGDEERFDIVAQAVVRPAARAARAYLTFDSRGRVDWSLGTIVICDSDGADEALALIVNGAGGFRRAQTTSASTDVVVDAFGEPVECPA